MEFNFIITMICLFMLLALVNKNVKRICKLEKNLAELRDDYEKLTLDVVDLDNRLTKRVDDVRKSLDGF